MGFEIITQFLDLEGYFVKDLKDPEKKIFITLDREHFVVLYRSCFWKKRYVLYFDSL